MSWSGNLFNDLDELRKQYGLVTVLCHEREGHCHRYVLEELAR